MPMQSTALTLVLTGSRLVRVQGVHIPHSQGAELTHCHEHSPAPDSHAQGRELVLRYTDSTSSTSSATRFQREFVSEAADEGSSTTLAADGAADATPATTQARIVAVDDQL